MQLRQEHWREGTGVVRSKGWGKDRGREVEREGLEVGEGSSVVGGWRRGEYVERGREDSEGSAV